ncbi:hypothetical protein LTR97_004971 [Elasticomyces elasticus]|uniref:Uncharacterized protein n=1 Tax=Elasticomyces elasticus TaxID=574655 RepID=A0AAN7ZNP0_9PEZI|nr:hypothetical protein LTR97_004971 [Elasticomyces elasticus]
MVSFLDGDNADDFLQVSGMCQQGLRTQDEPFAGGSEHDTSNNAMLPPASRAPFSPFAPFAPSELSPPLGGGFGGFDDFDIGNFGLFDGMPFEGEPENTEEQDGDEGIVQSQERFRDDDEEELGDADFTAGPRPAATDANNAPRYQGFTQMQPPAVGLFDTPGNVAPTTAYFPPAQTGWNGPFDLDPLSSGAQSSFGSLPNPNSQPPSQTWNNDLYHWNRYLPDTQPFSGRSASSISLPTNQPQPPNSSQPTHSPYPMPPSSHSRPMRDFGHIPTPAELAFGIAPFTTQTGYGTNEPFGASTMNTPHQHHQRQPQTHPVRYQHRRQERALDTSANLSPPASYTAQQGYGMQQPPLQQAQPPFLSSYAPSTGQGFNSTASQMPPPFRPSQYGQIGMRRQSTQPTSSSDLHGFGSSSSLSSSKTGAGMWRDHLGNTGVSGHHGQDEPLSPPRLRRRAPRSPQLDPARIEDFTTILDDFRREPNTASGPVDSALQFLGPSSRLRRRRQPTSTPGAVRTASSSSSGTNITRRKTTQRDAGRSTDDRKKPTKVTKASLRTPAEERKQTKEASKGSRKGKSSDRIIGHNPELERGQAAQADVALPETRATGVELLCFFPNHTQWPGVLRRLTETGWRGEEIAAARLYFRGAVQEDRVERHWGQIRKQQKWAKDVESVEDYGLSSFAPRKTQRFKEPQHELLAEIGRNVVEWPEQTQ